MSLSALIIALLVIVFSILLARFLRPQLQGIPYATSSIPLIGPAIAFGTDPVNYLAAQRTIHGDIFCVDLLATRITFFISPLANVMYTRKPETELSLFKLLESRLGQRIKELLAFPGGWAERSVHVMNSGFNDATRVAGWDTVLDPYVDKVLQRWVGMEEMDLFGEMSRLMLGAMNLVLMGEEWAGLYGEEVAGLCKRYETAVQNPLLGVMPQWASPAGREMWRIEKRVDLLVDEEIERRRRGEAGDSQGYLNLVLEREGYAIRAVLGRHVQGVYLGGHTNQAASLGWMVVHALSTPEIYDEIIAEHAHNPGTKPFLSACFREVGRLYTNLMMLRKVDTKPLQFPESRHNLPVGETIAITPAILARDTNIYGPAAGMFYPERFADKEAMEGHVKRKELLHWGGGAHACKGEKFAKNFIFENFWKRMLDAGLKFEVLRGVKVFGKVEIGGNVLEGGRRAWDVHGVVPSWAEENMGTPFVKTPVTVRVVRMK